MSDFNYTPSEMDVNKQPRAKSVKFGDGYEQRAADGINNNPAVFSLVFRGKDDTDADAIETFLDGKAGVTTFTWTPPGRSEVTVICRQWARKTAEKGLHDINCSFEEVYEA